MMASEVIDRVHAAVKSAVQGPLGLPGLDVVVDPGPEPRAPLAVLSLSEWAEDPALDSADGAASVRTSWMLLFVYPLASGSSAAKTAALRWTAYLRLNRLGLGEDPAVDVEGGVEDESDGMPGEDDVGIGFVGVSWTMRMDLTWDLPEGEHPDLYIYTQAEVEPLEARLDDPDRYDLNIATGPNVGLTGPRISATLDQS